MNKLLIAAASLIIYTFLSSCSSDDEMGGDPTNGLEKNRYGLVVNEGGFQQANSSMGLIDLDEMTYTANYFSNTANAPLGDIFHSIHLKNDLAFLIINNSGKIEVLDLGENEHLGTIDGLYSPRFMVSRDNEGWVSNLFSNFIQKIDLESMEVIGEIAFPGWSGPMIWNGDHLITSCPNRQNAYLVDLETQKIVDSVFTGINSEFLHQLPNEEFLAFSSGAFDGSEKPSITVFDSDLNILNSLEIDAGFIGAIDLDLERQRLYFADGDIYYIDLSGNQIGSPELLLSLDGISPYQISSAPNGDLYIADAKDFSGIGSIHVYSQDGNELYNFDAGIIPSSIYFY